MCLSRSSDFFKLLVKHPFTMGVRPQLIVLSGLSVGIPLTVVFGPQLVVSGLSVGIPLTVRFRLSQSLWLSRCPFINFLFSRWNFGYLGAFHELFFNTMESWLPRSPFTIFSFLTMEFWLSRSLFTNFSFSRWNSGYHEAFSRTFLFHD
jgi:hypothetical protein